MLLKRDKKGVFATAVDNLREILPPDDGGVEILGELGKTALGVEKKLVRGKESGTAASG